VLSWAARGAWRGMVFVLGLLLCAVGIALLFLPGPGLLVLTAGVALLATEFRSARTLLTRAKARLDAYRPRPPGSS
jgi:uncharacterized protein (TIGR02611 family)